VYPRIGINYNFGVTKGSLLAGIGVLNTYRLSDRWSLFGALGYQVSTSEGMGFSTTGMEVSAGSNGYFDIDFGVRLDIGRNQFYRDVESKRKAYSQPLTGHNWPRFAVNTIASVGVAYGVKRYPLQAMQQLPPWVFSVWQETAITGMMCWREQRSVSVPQN